MYLFGVTEFNLYESEDENFLYFSTNTMEETMNTVLFLSENETIIDYDDNGEVKDVRVHNYQGTEYNENSRLRLWFIVDED